MFRIRVQGFVNSAIGLLVAILLMLSYLGLAAASNKPSSLLVMGDSLSAAYGLKVEEGWVSLLARKLAQQGSAWRVVNASISGETTAGGVSRITDEIERHDPQLVIIALGANDGLRGLPLDLAKRNLERMIEVAKTSGARVLLIGIRIPPNYGPDYTEAFYGMYADLAKRHQLALLPFLLEPIAKDRSQFQDDNLHPTAAAQPKLLAHVWTLLGPMLL